MAKGEGARETPPRRQQDMASQQPPSLPAPSSAYLYSLPACVLEDFCQKMDCLSDYDWMRFASYVITDQTELRKIKCLEKTGISITRELMWWWGVRLATVQQLLDLLQNQKLYRAAQVIADWKSLSFVSDPDRAPQQENVDLHPAGNKNEAEASGRETPASSGSASSDPVSKVAPDMLALSPLPTSLDLPHSLQSDPPGLSSVKPCSSSVPHQETLPNLPSTSLLWAQSEVETATSGFSEENRISEGSFADVYKGRRHGNLYVVKKLKDNETQRFFHTEVQICFRCCHHNILRLLGFSVENGFHCLIYPYMPNGSLMDRLQCQGGSEPLTWEKRIQISLRLIQAIQHLHQFGIIHGNVKSSNVLLDANFAPQLGHSGLRLRPAEKKSEYAVMKTKVLQGFLAYLPEDFVRHGQLTEKVDIFGCGIVLAEILTGMKAMDERRHPVFLKDVLLDEIQAAKERLCSKQRTFERLAAETICYKFQDRSAVCLSATAAVSLSTAICVCLRRKNPDMVEACEIMEVVDRQLQDQNVLEGNKCSRLSVNTPEETNDEPASPFIGAILGNNHEGNVNATVLNCADLLPPLISVMPPEAYSEQMLRVPCESDESSSFLWDFKEDGTCQPPSSSHAEPESISFTEPQSCDPECTSNFTAENIASDRRKMIQETAASPNTMDPSIRENSDAACYSQGNKDQPMKPQWE
ncbi:interleukin-1 receptor-associated kinase-like 2 isoform X2 [Tiliqua scincoides]|uniref:interleukin-1 receptor-associated kinase-like 2 isoform X2 n=1 Tax=Tiliqua scincoides TaxID=71010 RepID=UPI003462AFE3